MKRLNPGNRCWGITARRNRQFPRWPSPNRLSQTLNAALKPWRRSLGPCPARQSHRRQPLEARRFLPFLRQSHPGR